MKPFTIRRGVLLLPLLAVLVASANSQSKPAAKPKAKRNAASDARFSAVAGIVQQAIDDGQIPGAVVLVGHDGKVVYRRAFGSRQVEPTREAMTVDTIFDMASLTKSLATAPSVMRLVETGLVRLSDPITKYIPECAQFGKEDITIRQLLTHYSGLRPDIDLVPAWTGYEEAIRLACQEKPVVSPNTRFIYSDTNYILLGELVRRVAKMPLNQYADSHLFAPLKLAHTRFLPPHEWAAKIAPTDDLEEGRKLQFRGIVHDPRARRMGGVAGHAGLFSCADDVAKYAQAMLDGKLLSSLTIQKMTTPQQPPNQPALRGFGWDIDTAYSTNRGELLPVGSYGHTGFTGTSLWIDPASKTYIVLLANGVHPKGVGGSVVSLRTRVASAVAAALELKPSERAELSALSLTGYSEAMAGLRRMASRNGSVVNGIDVLEATNFEALRDKDPSRVRTLGIVTNNSGLDLEGRRTIDLLAHAQGLKLAAIFSPEHGVTGTLDTTKIGNTVDAATGVTVYSVYGDTDAKRHPPLDVLKQLDAVVFDIQDAGARFYTYTATLMYFLEAAGKTGVEMVVLDRPNPITGSIVQGPVSDGGSTAAGGSCEGSTSCPFVDPFPEPNRHGMTMGELARMYNGERKLGARLNVIPMQGWVRGDWFDATGLPWVNPSPNLRDLTQETLYTGVAMIEGTNVSVGRGTDTPFEVMGAPWIKPRELSQYLNARNIAGVRFVPVTFTPAAGSKFGGQACGGVNIVLSDRSILDAPELGVELASALRKLYTKDFQIEKAIPLFGRRGIYDAIVAGEDPERIAEDWRDDLQRFMTMRQQYLLYK